MGFYQELSRYYDEVFAVEPSRMDFIKKSLEGCARILDVGCGTGNKTELLAAQGREIIGLDLDAGMIGLARQNHVRPGVAYQTGDMTAIGTMFPAGRFDGVLCLGNTLVHLLEPTEVAQFFKDVAMLLAPSGKLVVQILNYDFLAAGKVGELPLIETEHVVFRRRYDWRTDGLRFQTTLEVKGGGVYENDIPLRPIGREELEGVALSAGFRNLRFFGDSDGRPLVADSPALVLMADRQNM